MAKQSSRYTRVALVTRGTREPLFQLVCEQHAWCHGIDDAQCMAQIPFRFADQATKQTAQVERQGGATGFIAELLANADLPQPAATRAAHHVGSAAGSDLLDGAWPASKTP